MDRSQLIAIIFGAADSARIPRELLLGCALAEGNMNPGARRPADPAQDRKYWEPPDPQFDVSFGFMQQTVRWAAEYLAWSAEQKIPVVETVTETVKGDDGEDVEHQVEQIVGYRPHDPDEYPGDEVIERIGAVYLDPKHAAKVAAENLAGKYIVSEPDALLKALYRDNWPAGKGKPFSAQHVANYTRGLTEAREILRAGQPAPISLPTGHGYDPDAPVDLQDNDWSCSEQSAQWLLRAIGRHPGDAWIRDQLLTAGLVTEQYGLMDASGKALAAWLQAQYGDEMGLTFEAHDGVGWATVASFAGKQPIMLGGRAWNHWTGVRRLTDEGLALANPAPNWKNAGNVLDRDEFDRLGPWSLITVPLEDAEMIAEVQQQLAESQALAFQLQQDKHGLTVAVAHLADVVVPKAAAPPTSGEALAEAQRIREQFVGPELAKNRD